MKPLTFASILCGIGLMLLVGSQARRQPAAEPLPKADAAAKPTQGPYRIVQDDGHSNNRKTARFIEVELGESSRGKDVHAIFAEIARQSGSDSVFVRGYWKGDNSDLYGYTAGKLEWHKAGLDASGEDEFPAEGVFTAGKSPSEIDAIRASYGTARSGGGASSRIEDAARAYIASEPAGRTVEEKNYDAAMGLISQGANISEQRLRSMSRSDQARLAVKVFAAKLGVSEDEYLRMSETERRDAEIRYLSRKYGVSEDDTRRAWQMLAEQ